MIPQKIYPTIREAMERITAKEEIFRMKAFKIAQMKNVVFIMNLILDIHFIILCKFISNQ